MEVTGKIIVALSEMSGTSKTGNAWKKREYVLETQDQFPKKVHFDFFGERADQYPLSVGDTIKLSFDIESREYNGRWYTSIRGWKADKIDATVAASADSMNNYPTPPPTVEGVMAPPASFGTTDESDDLPF